MDKNLLTASERIRLMFFREFGEKAQDAIDFVCQKRGAFESTKPIHTTVTLLPENAEDGVYFCMKDGTSIKFTGQTTMYNVKHIGLVLGGIKFGVLLRDKGAFKLYSNYERCPDHAAYYTRDNGKNCFEEYDFIAATKRIQEIGTPIPLLAGEYIPLMRNWSVMMMFKSQLQAALVAAGGEKISEDDWYWSASEFSSLLAWFVAFSDGNTNPSFKYSTGRVRAIVAF